MKIDNQIITLYEMVYGIGLGAKKISINELIELIKKDDKENPDSTFISFTAIVDTNALKKDRETKEPNPYFSIYKVTQTYGWLRTNYEDNVNLQRKREGKEPDFKAEESKTIKERISKSIGITTQGNIVLIYRPAYKKEPIYVGIKNGNFEILDYEKIKNFLKIPSIPEKQGLEKPVEFLTYKFINIVGFKINKQEYLISDIDNIRKKIFELVQDKLSKD